jgi:NAD+ synthase
MFTRNVLAIDAAGTADRIEQSLRAEVLGALHRKGVVVALSGDLDSAVVATLAVRALGPMRVLGLLLPERGTPPERTARACTLAASLHIETASEDLDAALEGTGYFRRFSAALAKALPGVDLTWRTRLSFPPQTEEGRLNVSLLTAEAPDGTRRSARLSSPVLLELVSVMRLRQRVRAALVAVQAERRHFAVAASPGRFEPAPGLPLELPPAGTLEPTAQLYATQVHALSRYLGLPDDLRAASVWPDPLPLPPEHVDLCLYALNNHLPSEEVAKALGVAPRRVEQTFRVLEAKQRTASCIVGSAPLFDLEEE